MVGVMEKVYVAPKSADDNELVKVVEATEKSDENAVVGCAPLEQVMVHVMGTLTRRGGVLATQTRFDETEGVPKTTKLINPSRMETPLSLTEIEKELVLLSGVVENVKSAPPTLEETLDSVEEDAISKSLARPGVLPVFDDTMIEHAMVRLTREGLVSKQERTEAVVGGA